MDHLIHTLMREFLSEIEHRHKRQTLGMEGPDLAEKRRQQILTRAPETPIEKIQKIDDLHFKVQSSNSLKLYQIDLYSLKCDCIDFPNISLCKHIAAVVHFFGGADLGPQPPGDGSASASESAKQKSPGQLVGDSADADAAASILSAANEIISLSQRLITEAPNDPRIAKSLGAIQSRLSALVVSATAADNHSRLPEREYIAPNQHSWPETAARMGERHGKKRPHSKVDGALTAQHIGVPNRKRAADDDDLYGAGEQSGKRTKPDARSAAANTHVRAAEEQVDLPKAEPLRSQLPGLPPTLPPPVQLPHTLLPPPALLPPRGSPYTYPYHFHPPAPSQPSQSSQPVYSQTPSAPTYYPYPTYPFSSYSRHM
jgi:hypothetical protein